ncbi:hypothetical protein Tco_0355445 [Tanacetum coccineum]
MSMVGELLEDKEFSLLVEMAYDEYSRLETFPAVEFGVAVDLLCMNTPYPVASSSPCGLSSEKSISDSSTSSV